MKRKEKYRNIGSTRRVEKEEVEEGGETGRNGMCPKRRMHGETRKRYIRGLAAGDGRPGGHLSSTHIRVIFTCANVIHSREKNRRDEEMRNMRGEKG